MGSKLHSKKKGCNVCTVIGCESPSEVEVLCEQAMRYGFCETCLAKVKTVCEEFGSPLLERSGGADFHGDPDELMIVLVEVEGRVRGRRETYATCPECREMQAVIDVPLGEKTVTRSCEKCGHVWVVTYPDAESNPFS